MAKPDTALVLTLDPDEMTLDEFEVFEASGFSVKRFKDFMARYSNWTREQVGKLTRREVQEVAERIAQVFRDGALPKSSGAP